MVNYRKAYQSHKDRAKQDGIPFLLTYDEWLQVWEDSGHLHERGRKKGQYHMARYGDKGPYALGNVKIITGRDNIIEAMLRIDLAGHAKRFNTGLKRSQETRDKIASFQKGKPKSEEHRKKIAKAKLGKPLIKARGKRNPYGPQTDEHKRKRVEGYLKAVAARKQSK